MLSAKRDLLIVGAGRFVAALLSLVAVRIATTLLTPEQFGEYALLVVVQTFCGLFLISPVGVYISRHTHEWWDDGSLLPRFDAYRKYVLAASFIGSLASIIVSKQFSLFGIASVILAMILMINGATWNSTWMSLLNMIGLRSKAVGWSLISGVTGLLMAVLLYKLWPTATAWFAGQALGFALGSIGARQVTRSHAHPPQNTTVPILLDRHALSYCLPLAIGTGFMWLQQSGYRLLVEHYWGLTKLAFLSVGFLLAGQIWALTESLAQQFLYPLFYRRIAQSVDSYSSALSDLLNVLLPIYLVLLGMTVLGTPYLLKILVAPQYAEAEYFMKIGLGTEFCRVVANLLSNAAHVTKQTRTIILPNALGAAVALVLVIIAGEQHLAIQWVAKGLIFAAIILLLNMWLTMSREIRFFPDYKRWLTAAILMFGFVLPSFWLEHPTDWTEIIVALLLIGITGLILITGLLRGNSALQRLLVVDLGNERPAI